MLSKTWIAHVYLFFSCLYTSGCISTYESVGGYNPHKMKDDFLSSRHWCRYADLSCDIRIDGSHECGLEDVREKRKLGPYVGIVDKHEYRTWPSKNWDLGRLYVYAVNPIESDYCIPEVLSIELTPRSDMPFEALHSDIWDGDLVHFQLSLRGIEGDSVRNFYAQPEATIIKAVSQENHWKPWPFEKSKSRPATYATHRLVGEIVECGDDSEGRCGGKYKILIWEVFQTSNQKEGTYEIRTIENGSWMFGTIFKSASTDEIPVGLGGGDFVTLRLIVQDFGTHAEVLRIGDIERLFAASRDNPCSDCPSPRGTVGFGGDVL